MKIVIIIPTYNEAHNIEPLIQALQTQFLRINHEMHILVVDDNSPDGTADKVRGLMGVNPEIHLITGEKQGLGRAYIRGMQHALDGLKADAVMEMDADFSHRPEDVPGLIAALEDGGDFIIGSRYATGGKIPKEWGLWRTALSRWGNVYARYLTGLSQVRDCTAGFRVIKASLLRRLDLTGLRVKGYAFQIALLNQALLQKAVIKEVPVAFLGRVRGHTKLGLADIWEFFLMAWWMRFQNNDTFIKLAAVGISGILVNLGCFIFLVHGGLSKFIASPLAIELSIISNFIFNNYWTFGQRDTSDYFLIKGVKFKVVSLLTLLIGYMTFILANLLLPHLDPYIDQLIAVITAIIFNYVINASWTFKENNA